MHFVRFPKQDLPTVLYGKQLWGVWPQALLHEPQLLVASLALRSMTLFISQAQGNPKDPDDLQHSSTEECRKDVVWLHLFLSLGNPSLGVFRTLKTGLTGWRETAQPPSNRLRLLDQCDLHSPPPSKRFWAWVSSFPRSEGFANMVFLRQTALEQTVLTRGTCVWGQKVTTTNSTMKRSLRLYFQDKHQGTAAM